MGRELTIMNALLVAESSDISRGTAVCKFTERPGVGLAEPSILFLLVVEGETLGVAAASLRTREHGANFHCLQIIRRIYQSCVVVERFPEPTIYHIGKCDLYQCYHEHAHEQYW